MLNFETLINSITIENIKNLFSNSWGFISWKKFQFLIALSILLIVIFAALLAPLLPIIDPDEMKFDLIVSPPSKQHYLGTDSFGRDILSRTIYGARVSLRVGFVAVFLALIMGLPIGLLSGYIGGFTDAILMRLVDALLAFPAILLAVAFIGILGPGETSVMLGLGIVYTPIFARVARAKILSIRELDYVKAAKSIGASELRIICLHLLPNAVGPVIVQVTVAFAFAIIAEAGMSFLGLGTQPPTPSWGLMLAEARPYIQQSTWYPLVPGIVLTIVVLSVTIVGDRLREILDPHSN